MIQEEGNLICEGCRDWCSERTPWAGQQLCLTCLPWCEVKGCGNHVWQNTGGMLCAEHERQAVIEEMAETSNCADFCRCMETLEKFRGQE